MLDDRKTAILRAVVKEYIQTGQPVGSTHLARATGIGVSAATVRNDMAVLERDGYLAQPHTSAGRVPTDRGYRFFVDQLTDRPGSLPAAQKLQVRDFFAKAHGEIEQMLYDTSKLLSSLTDCAALVVAPPHGAATVRSVQVVSLGPRLAIVVAVLSDAAVTKATLELDADVPEESVDIAGAHLAAHLVGRTLAGAEAVPPSGNPVVDGVVASARRALAHLDSTEMGNLFVGGTSHMAATFEAVETVRRILAILEQQFLVVTMLRVALTHGPISVAIGAEHGVESLMECSIVVAPFDVGDQAGSVGVLGPTRMNYPRAMAAVALVSRGLGRHLSDG